ncbi:hypothetical protein K438DRAFT_1748341 [Mycena galopus ATCC 62051]|nr:hypothetical protein K438DRAFT_1748341 [Mycena galopus ATCC 62051]
MASSGPNKRGAPDEFEQPEVFTFTDGTKQKVYVRRATEGEARKLVDSLEAENLRLKQQIGSYEDDKKGLEATISNAQTATKEWEVAYNEMEQQSTRFGAQIKALEKDKDTTNLARIENSTRIAELTTLVASLEGRQTTVDALEAENLRLKQEIGSYDDDKKGLEATISNAQTATKEWEVAYNEMEQQSTRFGAQIKALEKDKDTTNLARIEDSNRIAELTTLVASLEEGRQTTDDLKAKLHDALEAKSNLVGKAVQFEAMYEDQKKELGVWRDKVDKLANTNKQLEVAAKLAEEEETRHIDQIGALETERDDLDAQIEALEHQNSEFPWRLEQNDKHIAELASEAAELRTLERDLADAQESAATFETLNSELEKALDKREDEEALVDKEVEGRLASREAQIRKELRIEWETKSRSSVVEQEAQEAVRVAKAVQDKFASCPLIQHKRNELQAANDKAKEREKEMEDEVWLAHTPLSHTYQAQIKIMLQHIAETNAALLVAKTGRDKGGQGGDNLNFDMLDVENERSDPNQARSPPNASNSAPTPRHPPQGGSSSPPGRQQQPHSNTSHPTLTSPPNASNSAPTPRHPPQGGSSSPPGGQQQPHSNTSHPTPTSPPNASNSAPTPRHPPQGGSSSPPGGQQQTHSNTSHPTPNPPHPPPGGSPSPPGGQQQRPDPARPQSQTSSGQPPFRPQPQGSNGQSATSGSIPASARTMRGTRQPAMTRRREPKTQRPSEKRDVLTPFRQFVQKQLGIRKDNEIDKLAENQATPHALADFANKRIGPAPNDQGIFPLDMGDVLGCSEWNQEVGELLIKAFLKGGGNDVTPAALASAEIDEKFLRGLWVDRLKSIRQAVLHLSRAVNDPDYMTNLNKSARQVTHRSQLFNRRQRSGQLAYSQAVQKLFAVLFTVLNGQVMSSDDEIGDERRRKTCRVIRKDWRNKVLINLLKWLDYNADQHNLTASGVSSGPSPHPRIRSVIGPNTKHSSSPAITKLPHNLYCPLWLSTLSEAEQDRLETLPEIELPLEVFNLETNNKFDENQEDKDEFWRPEKLARCG